MPLYIAPTLHGALVMLQCRLAMASMSGVHSLACTKLRRICPSSQIVVTTNHSGLHEALQGGHRAGSGTGDEDCRARGSTMSSSAVPRDACVCMGSAQADDGRQ